MSKRRQKLVLLLTVTAILGLGVHRLQAQDEGGSMPEPPPEQAGEENFGFRPPDPARMHAIMLERIKDDLDAPEEEWTALKPLLTEVMQLRTKSIPGGMGMGIGTSGPGGPDDPGETPESLAPPRGMMVTSSPEAAALMSVIVQENASADQIEAKLAALRQTRAKQEQSLKTAREKLTAVSSIRQEAILVLSGLLE